MTDKISPKQRSELMSKISTSSQLERTVAKELYRRGIRYRKNNRKLFGTPDISIIKYKIVIFIDSCFWHHCPIHGNIPKTNTSFWIEKLGRNTERDIEVNKYYSKIGWHILRIWEHDLQDNFNVTIDQIINFINDAKKTPKTLN